jgi:hypothetical protein
LPHSKAALGLQATPTGTGVITTHPHRLVDAQRANGVFDAQTTPSLRILDELRVEGTFNLEGDLPYGRRNEILKTRIIASAGLENSYAFTSKTGIRLANRAVNMGTSILIRKPENEVAATYRAPLVIGNNPIAPPVNKGLRRVRRQRGSRIEYRRVATGP